MLQPGTQVGRYEIQRRLGRGGMGTVYVAHDPVLGRMVAIKVFLSDLDLPDAAERFTREARSAAALNHPNIVTIHDYGEFSSQPYIVMEYVPGETLTEIIRRKGPVSVADRLRWLEELCSGVAYAHKIGVIHRDIKPTNLMIERAGRLKVLDFGIARMLGTLASNATALIGTPGYMAPEQILGKAIDHRSDLFSIGVVSYELLSYTDAFPGDTLPTITHRILNDEPAPLREIVPDINQELADVVERSLKKNADERFSDVESLRVALARVRQQLGEDPGWDASAATIIRPGLSSTGARPGTGSQRKSSQDAVGVAQLTPPPDPNRTNREDIVRRRQAQIEAALTQARSCLQIPDLDAALEACVQALTIDDQHAEAVELEHTIQMALARRRAVEIAAEARQELGRGSLTMAQDLLQQARSLDPEAADVKRLERELRLARSDQERLRQRAQALSQAIEAARQALERGEIEAALAQAREALDLDPASPAAKALEAQALLRIDEETGAGAHEDAPPAPLTNAGAAAGVAPTIIVKSPRRTPVPAPPQKKTPDVVAKQPKPARPSPLAPLAAYVASTRAAFIARPKREKQIIGGIAAAVVLVAAVIAGVLLVPRTVQTGTMVIDAIPWATIAAIEAEDGTQQQLPQLASTPMSLSLPVGTYRIRLVGPPPGQEARVVTVQVATGGVATVPTEHFQQVTPEEYFEQYLPSATLAPPAASEQTAPLAPEAAPAAAPAAAPPTAPAPGGR